MPKFELLIVPRGLREVFLKMHFLECIFKHCWKRNFFLLTPKIYKHFIHELFAPPPIFHLKQVCLK